MNAIAAHCVEGYHHDLIYEGLHGRRSACRFVRDSHSERSPTESKNPEERPVGFASGLLDFARNDSKINCVSEFQFGGEFVWWPSPELIAKSNLQQFIEKHRLGSYDELMRRSTTDIAWFWDSVLRDLDIQFYKPYSRVVDLSDGKPWAKWCVDGEMNIVHNLLDKYADTPIDQKVAIKSEIEDGTSRSVTYRELRDQVDRMANSLR